MSFPLKNIDNLNPSISPLLINPWVRFLSLWDGTVLPLWRLPAVTSYLTVFSPTRPRAKIPFCWETEFIIRIFWQLLRHLRAAAGNVWQRQEADSGQHNTTPRVLLIRNRLLEVCPIYTAEERGGEVTSLGLLQLVVIHFSITAT